MKAKMWQNLWFGRRFTMAIKTALASATAVFMAMVLPVSAATISLKYDGPSANDPKNATITVAPVAPGSGGWPKTVGAYGFEMTDTSGQMGSFLAWCLDVSHYLATSGSHSYTVTTTPFSNSYGLDLGQMARVQSVFDANFTSLDATVGIQAAGFQLALWNALYDTDWLIAGGAFSATASSDILSLANSYLASADLFAGDSVWNLTFLESNTGKQNLVTATPVPLPAAGLLLLAALGGLGIAHRRRS
jgi:hypothetical protein